MPLWSGGQHVYIKILITQLIYDYILRIIKYKVNALSISNLHFPSSTLKG